MFFTNKKHEKVNWFYSELWYFFAENILFGLLRKCVFYMSKEISRKFKGKLSAISKERVWPSCCHQDSGSARSILCHKLHVNNLILFTQNMSGDIGSIPVLAGFVGTTVWSMDGCE